MSIRLIVATEANWGFGNEGKIPWHYTEDMKHFKDVTTGHICVMGKNTYLDMYEYMKDKDITDGILSNRTCYVVTSDSELDTPGATKVSGLREVRDLHPTEASPTEHNSHIFVIGGEKLYIQGLSWVTHAHITYINKSFTCDRFFPMDYIQKRFKLQKDGCKSILTKKDNTELFILEYKRS